HSSETTESRAKETTARSPLPTGTASPWSEGPPICPPHTSCPGLRTRRMGTASGKEKEAKADRFQPFSRRGEPAGDRGRALVGKQGRSVPPPMRPRTRDGIAASSARRSGSFASSASDKHSHALGRY